MICTISFKRAFIKNIHYPSNHEFTWLWSNVGLHPFTRCRSSRWSTVCNARPTLDQHRVNISCFAEMMYASLSGKGFTPLSSIIVILNLFLLIKALPANTTRQTNVGSMLGWRRGRWSNIEPTLVQRVVFAGLLLGTKYVFKDQDLQMFGLKLKKY